MKKSRKVIRWKTIPTTWRRMNMTTKERSMTFETLFAAMKAPRWIAALVSLAITMPALAQCPLSFAAAANYVAGNGPFSVAVGDFNTDGRPDMAVANVNSDNVSVFLNTVAGFPPPAIIQQPAASQIVAAGQNAALAITANGFGNTLTYQWRKNGTPLASGGNISGATSPTLTFTPALLSDFALTPCRSRHPLLAAAERR